MAEREEELKSPLMRVKEESERVGLKFNIQKTKIMPSSNINLCQIDGEKWKYETLFSWAHKSQQKVTAAMKLKDACFLTYLLRNLYVSQEAAVGTGHGTIDWFQIEKGIWQGCILSPCLFNFCAEYIMWNAGLGESQAGINIARRSINNLRYADDTTVMAESEEELKSLLMRVKEKSEKAGLKLNIKKN